jgi:chromosome segregation ATPase
MSEQIPNVSLKDTKETIFKAFQIAQAQLKAAAAGKLDIKAEEKAKLTAAAVTAASELSVVDVETFLDTLTTDFKTVLKSFGDVQAAVAAQEAKLKELFGIEDTAHALVALVNAKQATADEYDARLTERTSAAEVRLAEIQKNINEAQTKYQQDLRAQQQADQQARDRSKAEWEYDFARNKKAAQDSLSDELAAKRKVFNTELEAERNSLAKDVAAVEVRHAEVTKREQNIKALEERVAGIPAEIDAHVRAAEGKLSGILKASFESDKKLIAAQNEADTKIKDNKIQTLEGQLEKANGEIAALREQLAKASADIKEMATATVNAASDSKLAAHMSRTVSELSANKGTMK